MARCLQKMCAPALSAATLVQKTWHLKLQVPPAMIKREILRETERKIKSEMRER